MLPLPAFDGPIPDLTTEPNLESLFGELLSATDAAAADVRHNWTVLSSTNLCSGEIPILPSLDHHPPQDQHDIRNNDRNHDSFTTEHFSTLAEQNLSTLLHTSSEEQNNLQVDLGNSQVRRCDGMFNQDHHENSLSESSVNPETSENKPISEAGTDVNRQGNGRTTIFETLPPLGAADMDSSNGYFVPCSQLPASELLPQQLGFTLTRSAGGAGVIFSSENPECLPTQDTVGASLTHGSSLSPFFHVRPNDENSERPAKRQRRSKAMTLSNLTPSASPQESVSTSHIDELLNHGCIMSNNQSQLVAIPIEDETVIPYHLTKNAVDYQCTRNTDDSNGNQGAIAGSIEGSIHLGEEVTYDRLLQSNRSQAEEVRITRSRDYIQTQGHHAANVKGERTSQSTPRRSMLPAVGITGLSSAESSKSKTKRLTRLHRVESLATGVERNACTDGHPLRLHPGNVEKSAVKPNIRGKAKVDHRKSLEASSLNHIFDATAKTQNSPAISGMYHPHLSGANCNQEGEQYGRGAVIETPESVLKELEATVVGCDSDCVIMRLESPPECKVCEKLYITDEDLKKHMRTAHGKLKSDVHKCKECNLTFTSKTNLERHKHGLHSCKDFRCTLCGAGFSKKRGVVLHKKMIHRVIPKSAQKKKALTQSCASGEKKVLIYYACLRCDYSDTTKGNLLRHFRGTHLNERPFQCKYCGKPGKTKQNIVFHELSCQKKQKDLARQS